MITSEGRPWLDLLDRVATWPAGYRVLEIGTKQSLPGRSTHSAAHFPQAGAYVKADYQDGADVDVVADIMNLADKFPAGSFDLVVCNSTFEHVARPWVAADEIHRVLRPGGLCFVQTHQSFPLHAYPFDYWRFTVEALEVLFYAPKWRTVKAAYEFPCQVVSERDPQGRLHPAFLNVAILTERTQA